jgi:DNA-binding IclR family transcriptional regulator
MSTPRNLSVIKAFAMLNSFSRPDEWLTSSELSRRAHLPEASGYRLIKTLEEVGAVTRGPKGRYRAGMLLVSLSQKVIVGDLMHEASSEVAGDLAKRLDVTCHVGIFESGMVTYVTKASTSTSFEVNTRPGAQLEAYCSGLGKVLLAELPDEEIDNFIREGELVALTPHTITNKADMRAHLDDVRAQGYAMDNREIQLDMCCLAVPIRDRDGKAIAALSCTEAADRVTPERRDELVNQLQQAAIDISSRLVSTRPISVRKTVAKTQCQNAGLPSAAPFAVKGTKNLVKI